MSLKISNKLTAKQKDILQKLEYCGTWDLTVDEANKLIEELYAEKRLTMGEMQDLAGDYIIGLEEIKE